jgi:hypothetical protein
MGRSWMPWPWKSIAAWGECLVVPLVLKRLNSFIYIVNLMISILGTWDCERSQGDVIHLIWRLR